MSGPAFARQCGIKYPTFASWTTKAKASNDLPPSQQSGQSFLIAEISNSPCAEGLTVNLPGGASAHVSTPDEARLLGILLKSLA